MPEFYAQIVPDPSREHGWKPNVPEEIPPTEIDEIDPKTGKRVVLTSPAYGVLENSFVADLARIKPYTDRPHAVMHCKIAVPKQVAPYCTEQLALNDLPERDKITLEVFRQEGWSPIAADSAFDAIDMAGADTAKRRMVKDVLLQCVARGLSGAKAESIRVRLDLPKEGAIGPGDISGGHSGRT